MPTKSLCKKALAAAVLILSPAVTSAQSAATHVDVGPGFAGAGGQATGQWQFVDSNSRVHNGTSSGNAIAVGAGPNGLALSHSIGVHGGGVGTAHNFNLAIGRGGTHVSNGGVAAQGGNARVVASGNALQGPSGPQGGSAVTGFGERSRAYSNSRSTHRNHSAFFPGGTRPTFPGAMAAGIAAHAAQGHPAMPSMPRHPFRRR